MATADATRIAAIAGALRQAALQQGAAQVADLDFEALARIAEALASGAGPAVNPVDPEGDGLKPNELNAANDG